MRLTVSAVFVALTLAASTRVPMHAAQSNASAQKLPPLQYVCVMKGDEDVLEDKPGTCPNPKCGMPLVPVRLESKFWCPTHQAAMISDTQGKCRYDGKELIQVILNEYWTCAEEPGSRFTEPSGKCTNGQPRKVVFEPRAHGDHNPKHDGQFFMAEDKWHHVEGTYPSAGFFRLYYYDNFSKPLNAKGVSGSVVIYDPKSDVDKELGSFPLAISPAGTTMEAKIPAAIAALPLKAAAKLKLDTNKPPQRFDFTFSAYSKDAAPVVAPAASRPATSTANTPARPAAPRPATPPAAAPRTAAAAPTPAAQAPSPTPPPAQTQAPLILDSPLQMPPGLAEALDESKLPNDVPGLLRELSSRADDVDKLVKEGSLAQVWLPAVATKTVALILDTRAGSLGASQHAQASAAVKRVVTAAWELDAYGDLGDRTKITEAYQRLESAVADLKTAYGAR